MNGSANRSGLAVAMRQGAIQLRDLHEDTTRPGQGREGGREEAISLSTCLSINWKELITTHYLVQRCHYCHQRRSNSQERLDGSITRGVVKGCGQGLGREGLDKRRGWVVVQLG